MPISQGLLVVISGPAGSGKSTLVENYLALEDARARRARRAVTATTRIPRPGEKDGRDYHFLAKDEFRRMVSGGEFIEYTEFNGHLYGTPSRSVHGGLSGGGVLILVIEVEGAEAMRRRFPDAVFIFVIPPTPSELRRRLEGRGTESPGDVERRLAIAEGEITHLETYDFLIVNGEIREATADLAAVIRAVERSRITGGEEAAWRSGAFA